MQRKRVILFVSVMMIILSILIVRLAQIQLFETKHFTNRDINLISQSVAQRSKEIAIDAERGNFLDRDGKQLTVAYKTVLILFPFLKDIEWDVSSVAEILKVDKNQLRQKVQAIKNPIVFGDREPFILSNEQMEEINQLEIPGVFAVRKSYPIYERPAEQLLGIANRDFLLTQRYPNKHLSNITRLGATGMEKSFDELLSGEGETKLIYHVDGKGRPLFGSNVKYVHPANPFYPLNIRTTLDFEWQQRMEMLVDKNEVTKGGMVLIDIEDNSVVAMVSRPKVNPVNPFAHGEEGTNNFMVQNQVLGSIFKTVIAAAAIDYGLDAKSRMFDCNQSINGEIDKNYQYGMLNFKDSFARSCNYTFATVGKELMSIEPLVMDSYANKLGLSIKVGWQGDFYHLKGFQQMADEEQGQVFSDPRNRKDTNLIALTSIGQLDVRSTPLAVANMMATIARGGEKQMVRVASQLEYKNGMKVKSFQPKRVVGKNIKPYTAISLQKLLLEVVNHDLGTGRQLQNLPYQVAGKSGTGETGKKLNGQELENKWFAGYFPYDNPRYALVTVRLDAKSTDPSPLSLFADIVKEIHRLDHSM